MDEAAKAAAGAHPEVCQGTIAKTTKQGEKVECVFSDGSSILLSCFLASFLRLGDEVRFPLALENVDGGTELYIRNPRSPQRRRDIYHALIGYAAQPQKDKRGNLFVSAQVLSQHLGISAIHIRCDTLRDYFYASDRRSGWNQQSSFYELLRISPAASPAEIRVAFKLRIHMKEMRSAPKHSRGNEDMSAPFGPKKVPDSTPDGDGSPTFSTRGVSDKPGLETNPGACNFEQLLDATETARLVHCHVKTLERYARRGIIPGYKIHGRWYFRASDLDSWLRAQVKSVRHPCRVN